MPKRSSAGLPPLGELEEAVLEHLWRVGEADVQETHRAIGRRRRISVNTVGSALERLHKKDLVTRTKVSHAYRYEAAMERDEFLATRVLEAAGGVSALADRGVLAAFVELVDSSESDALDELEALIVARREGRGQG